MATLQDYKPKKRRFALELSAKRRSSSGHSRLTLPKWTVYIPIAVTNITGGTRLIN